ncbi:hypothetical protein [Campylobacter sp. MIT 21-1682]|uniref:hypothetical protein n=1 Tax=Campylobacter sp. MIT 21-1682 TaxID=2993734 RepID=UPI00224A9E3E|nr:hypothetical protein [Campylobacter sp. MIT 21-1682]MCX2750617.1 hypothetical protein [Campylobacter sp. MIT 21-1682]
MQNSAKKRIQNHLAYKLGQAMIHFNKEKKRGGGILELYQTHYKTLFFIIHS